MARNAVWRNERRPNVISLTLSKRRSEISWVLERNHEVPWEMKEFPANRMPSVPLLDHGIPKNMLTHTQPLKHTPLCTHTHTCNGIMIHLTHFTILHDILKENAIWSPTNYNFTVDMTFYFWGGLITVLNHAMIQPSTMILGELL